jgi:hypothetical protein
MNITSTDYTTNSCNSQWSSYLIICLCIFNGLASILKQYFNNKKHINLEDVIRSIQSTVTNGVGDKVKIDIPDHLKTSEIETERIQTEAEEK